MHTLKLVATILLFTTSLAWGAADVDCSYDTIYKDGPPATQFTALQQSAMAVGAAICKQQLDIGEGDPVQLDAAAKDQTWLFLLDARTAIETSFPPSIFPDIDTLTDAWINQVLQEPLDYRNFSLINASIKPADTTPPRNGLELSLADGSNAVMFDLSNTQRQHCAAVVTGAKCFAAFENLSNAIHPFQVHITDAVLRANGRKIASLQSEWNRFISESRYQTPLDVWVTTQWYRSKFSSDRLVGPPTAQLFALHPTLVYEHIDDDAIKGDRSDVSLAIEWVGINWWQKGIGVSLTSTYRDSAIVDTTGLGVTFHIKNKYSIGWTRRGDDTDAVFVNIDLLEWFGDKQEKYEKYKGYF